MRVIDCVVVVETKCQPAVGPAVDGVVVGW